MNNCGGIDILKREDIKFKKLLRLRQRGHTESMKYEKVPKQIVIARSKE
jgi:hypothetical protein